MDLNFSTIVGVLVVLVILAMLITGRRKKSQNDLESGVVLEQAPYKVETPVVPTVTETVEIKQLPVAPVAEEKPAKKPAKKPATPKVGEKAATSAKTADKKTVAKKPAAKKAPAKAKKPVVKK